MRKRWLAVALVVAALGGLACQGGGGVDNPTEETTQSPENGYIEGPCEKTDAALAAPATDPCDEMSS